MTILIFLSAISWLFLILEYGKVDECNRRLNLLIRKNVVKDFLVQYRPVADNVRLDTLIVIPAFNEESNLKEVIPRVQKCLVNSLFQILIVNDGSSDSTESISQDHGVLVANHPINMGGGLALRTGFEVANSLGISYIVTIDADGQHDPADINTVLEPILNNEADIVIGSRVLGSYECDSYLRHVGVICFSKLINLLMGTKITDCSSGLRAFRCSSLNNLQLTQNQYHTAELIIAAAKMSLRIVERPITISKRISGHSKKGNNIRYGWNFMKSILKSWFR